MKFADIDMNIKMQALLVLRALSDRDMPDAWRLIQSGTSAWYNGRERGVCITFLRKGKSLAVTFGECRNSDSIFIDHFEVKVGVNPPTVNDFSEEAYRQRRYAPYLGIEQAIEIIHEILSKWAELAEEEAGS
jgi:hypothetical protein